MKAAKDQDGNRIIEGSKVIAPRKGYDKPVLAKVVGVKTVNLLLEHNDSHFVARAEDCVLFREEKGARVNVDHDFERLDWVQINKPQSPVHKHKGRILDFPAANLAYVIVRREGQTALAPICHVDWLTKI